MNDIRRVRSRNKVLISLQRGAKRFKDLENETKLSPGGLSAVLKMLTTDKEIEHTLVDDKPGYKITKKGKTAFDDLFLLTHDVEKIKKREGKHYRDYSHLRGSMITCDLPWGIESDLTLDKEIDEIKVLENKDVEEIEEMIFGKISNNIKKKKLSVVENGNMVLGFNIDYNELIKSIKEDSLTYIDHISKEEGRIRNKIGEDPEQVTEKEWSKLKVLREKTYEKIKDK